MHYMICPLDLTLQQQHIYTLLYRRCDFNTMKVKYTVEQLVLDSDKVLELTPKKVRKILNELIEENHLLKISSGSRGKATLYQIVKEIDKNGQEKGQNLDKSRAKVERKKGKINQVIEPLTEVQGQKFNEKRAKVGQNLGNPIKDKDKEINIYIGNDDESKKNTVTKNTSTNPELIDTAQRILDDYPKNVKAPDKTKTIGTICKLLENYSETEIKDAAEKHRKETKDNNPKKDAYESFMKAPYDFFETEAEDMILKNRNRKNKPIEQIYNSRGSSCYNFLNNGGMR